MVDLLLLGMLALVAWLVSADGPWSATLTLVSVILAGFVAMNGFEPLAELFEARVFNTIEWRQRWDIIAFLGLFAGAVAGFRRAGEWLLPTEPPLPPLASELGRWAAGLATGYVMVALTLTALHVSPMPREFGGFAPESRNFFGLAPDRQWLGWTQYLSEHNLARGSQPRLFDGARFPANPNDPQLRTWASFPLKYAARRQAYTSGVAERPLVAPPGAPRPTSGSGGF